MTDQRDLIAEARELNTPDDEAGFLLLTLATALEGEREQKAELLEVLERVRCPNCGVWFRESTEGRTLLAKHEERV